MNELQEFYNEQANKFSWTRNKPRPEFDLILEYIKPHLEKKSWDKIKILELGCWDWRFYRYLKEIFEKDNKTFEKNFEYTWVDFSQWLLDIAEKKSTDWNRVCEDMIKFLTKQWQEEFDFVISIASIQHIPTLQKRNLLIKLIHRTLKYWSKHISINRAMSDVFKRKFKKSIKKSILKRILTLWSWDRNNVFVPFKTEKKTYQRLYHIFNTKEIQQITKRNGLILSDIFFVGKNWDKTDKQNSRNIFFVQTKDIFTPSK